MTTREGDFRVVAGGARGAPANALYDALRRSDDVLLRALADVEREMEGDAVQFDILTDDQLMNRLRPVRVAAYSEPPELHVRPVPMRAEPDLAFSFRQADIRTLRAKGHPVDETSYVIIAEKRIMDRDTHKTRFWYDYDDGD